MEQSHSWEANRFSASQEIPCTLWNPKVHYRIHKYRPSFPILNHIDPDHTPSSHFLKIHLNIIYPFKPGSSKWSLSLMFPDQNPVYASPLPRTCYMPSQSHSSLLDHPSNTWWVLQVIKPLIMCFLHSLVTSPLLGPNILLNTLLSNTLRLRSSLNLTNTDIHAPGGIRTHNPSKRAAADPRLRPRGHWDRRGLLTSLFIASCILRFIVTQFWRKIIFQQFWEKASTFYLYAVC